MEMVLLLLIIGIMYTLNCSFPSDDDNDEPEVRFEVYQNDILITKFDFDYGLSHIDLTEDSAKIISGNANDGMNIYLKDNMFVTTFHNNNDCMSGSLSTTLLLTCLEKTQFLEELKKITSMDY
jgi:hypothetical protein